MRTMLFAIFLLLLEVALPLVPDYWPTAHVLYCAVSVVIGAAGGILMFSDWLDKRKVAGG